MCQDHAHSSVASCCCSSSTLSAAAAASVDVSQQYLPPICKISVCWEGLARNQPPPQVTSVSRHCWPGYLTGTMTGLLCLPLLSLLLLLLAVTSAQQYSCNPQPNGLSDNCIGKFWHKLFFDGIKWLLFVSSVGTTHPLISSWNTIIVPLLFSNLLYPE